MRRDRLKNHHLRATAREAVVFGAAIGIAASLLLGLGFPGARIALTVIEAFAALFLLIVIATRWFLTRQVSTLAVVALCLTGYSLWFAIRHSMS